MATYINYPYLFSAGWYLNDAKTSGTSECRMVLLRNTGTPPTVSTLRGCADLAAMLGVTNASEATFSGYTQGGMAVTGSNLSVVDDFANRKQTFTVAGTYLWNPGGGAVNNTMFASVLIYRANTSLLAPTNYNQWRTLAICTDSTGTTAITYSTTFGTVPAQGPV